MFAASAMARGDGDGDGGRRVPGAGAESGGRWLAMAWAALVSRCARVTTALPSRDALPLTSSEVRDAAVAWRKFRRVASVRAWSRRSDMSTVTRGCATRAMYATAPPSTPRHLPKSRARRSRQAAKPCTRSLPARALEPRRERAVRFGHEDTIHEAALTSSREPSISGKPARHCRCWPRRTDRIDVCRAVWVSSQPTLSASVAVRLAARRRLNSVTVGAAPRRREAEEVEPPDLARPRPV